MKTEVVGLVTSLALFLGFLDGITVAVAMAVDSRLEGTEWMLVEVSGVAVSPTAGGRRPFIKLNKDQKQATGFSGCNNFFAGYERDGALLTFSPVGATRMACPDLQIGLETELFSALDKTRSWRTQGNKLFLLNDNNVLAGFAAAGMNQRFPGGELEISGTVWQWMQTLYSDDRKVVPSDPTNYTLQFRKDGTLNVKADCNQKGGTYSAFPEERRLSIEITHSTMAACPEGSLEDEFARALSAASIYFLKDGDLYVDLKYDSGTMKFSKKLHHE